MAIFSLYEPTLDKNEGVLSDDKARDPADPTVYGIARGKRPDFQGWPIYDGLTAGLTDIEDKRRAVLSSQTLRDMARPFRKAGYWDRFRLDACPSQRLAETLADGAFNSGFARAFLILRRALNVMNRQGRDWQDLDLGTPSRLPDGISWATYEAFPIYLKTPVLMIYPPDRPYTQDAERCLLAAVSKGFEDELYKGIGALRLEWTYSWMERDGRREDMRGLLDRPLPEI